MKKRIAVLGAGPTGLSAAWKLLQNNFEVDLLEKKDKVGGMAASVKRGKYTLDYGPHDFHIKNGQPQLLIKTIYDYELGIIKRKTKMLLDGEVYSYPFRILELLRGLDPKLSVKIMLNYFTMRVKNKFSPKLFDSFQDWGINQFGKALYDICFGWYTEKVWGMSPARLSPSLGQQKVLKKLSLINFIKNMLGINEDQDQYTHYYEFAYPLRGSGHFFEEIAKNVKHMGGNIYLNTKINRIKLNGETIQSLEWRNGGVNKETEYDAVISTIPLPSLVNLIYPHPAQEVTRCANKLKYRAVILLYLVIDKEYATDAQMVYLLDKKFECNRMTEQKHFSKLTIPDDKTVITFERCCNKNDEVWNASDEQLYNMILKEVKYLDRYFTKDDIKDYFVVRLEDAYPIFELNYEDNLKGTLDYICSIENVMTAGRGGLFLNNDMQECMVLGIGAAQGMIDKFRNRS